MSTAADLSIAECFREVAAANAATEALVTARTRLTYEELDDWSDAVASDIAATSTTPDRAVALVLHDSVSLVVATLGAIKAGRYFVAVDASEPDERRDAIIAAAGVSLVVVDREARGIAGNVPVIALRLRPPHRVALPEATPHELVQLVFTSGTTGVPKAIATRQRGFVARMRRASGTTGRSAGERVSYTALPGFARATQEILGSLLNGATLVGFDARSETLDALVARIATERVSVLTLTPALFRRFIAVLRPENDLSSVRKLRLGADVVNVADIEAYNDWFPAGCTLERSFNATETGPVLHMTIEHDMTVEGPLVPIGRPRHGVTVRLVDEEGNDVPDGADGEMLVTSESVAGGYWDNPELTAHRFFREHREGPWTFRTGDFARRDADGLFYFLGRRDERIKIHGRRIDPVEIETTLVRCAGVREAIVVGKLSTRDELRLCAYVVMRAGETFVPRTIRTALRGRVANWMIPSRIYELDSMPISAAGKVDRRKLAVRPEADDDWAIVVDESIEARLCAIWSEAIGTAVSPDDDFFEDLGGESIIAAQIITEVNRAFGRSMPLSLLLELRSVRTMADYVRLEPDTDHVTVPIRSEGTAEPLFLVAGGGGSVLRFRDLVDLLPPEVPAYGVTHHGFTVETFPRTVESLAACYVDAVRRTQPHGPYYLAGYSIGGRIAFSMARQLDAAGEEVAFVGMFDTRATVKRADVIKRAAKYVSSLRRRPLQNVIRYTRAVARRILRIARWGLGMGWTFATFATPEIDALNRELKKLDFLPTGHFRGETTLFLAELGWGNDGATEDLGWNEFCDSVNVVRVYADHHTMIRDDVELLGSAMSEELMRVRAERVERLVHSSR